MSPRIRSALGLLACVSVAIVAACASGETSDTGYEQVSTVAASGAGGGGAGGGSGGSGGGASSSGAGGGSGGSGGTSSQSSTSHAQSSSQSSTSTGQPCNDGDSEPNDTEATAVPLPDISDNDDDGSSFSGTLHDADDVDWWSYHGDDDVGYVVDPTRDIDAAAGLRICKFVDCDNGNEAEVSCTNGAVLANSPSGLPGCCSLGPFEIGPDCGGFDDDDSSTVYIRIDEPEAACLDYSVTYHY